MLALRPGRPNAPRPLVSRCRRLCAGLLVASLAYAALPQKGVRAAPPSACAGATVRTATAAGTSNTAAAASNTAMGVASSQLGGLPEAINSFGNSLMDKVAAEAGPGSGSGLFLSPYGIAQALAMLLNGVQPGGESYQQLQAAVFGGAPGNSLSLDALNMQVKELSDALVKEPSEDLTVSDANSAWLAQRYSLQQQYTDVLERVFGTAAQTITTAAAVNGWVSEATKGKIKDIVDDGALQQAVLVLINAVYFKGLWQHQFNKRDTFPNDFHLLSHGATQQAATMYQTFKGRTAVQTATLPASVGEAQIECAAVRLPYRCGEYVGVAAMPLGDWSSEAAEGGVRGLLTTAGTVPYTQALAACRRALLSNLHSNATSSSGGSSRWQVPHADLKLFLPRFEVEFGTSLNRALLALGITKPFQGGDISQIAADQAGNPVGDLVVSDVVHKVYAKVDEVGTEAAAATAVMMMRCALMAPTEEIELRFDRPFVFAVVHEPTGLALFSGEVYRPEEWSQQ